MDKDKKSKEVTPDIRISTANAGKIKGTVKDLQKAKKSDIHNPENHYG